MDGTWSWYVNIWCSNYNFPDKIVTLLVLYFEALKIIIIIHFYFYVLQFCLSHTISGTVRDLSHFCAKVSKQDKQLSKTVKTAWIFPIICYAPRITFCPEKWKIEERKFNMCNGFGMKGWERSWAEGTRQRLILKAISIHGFYHLHGFYPKDGKHCTFHLQLPIQSSISEAHFLSITKWSNSLFPTLLQCVFWGK